MKKIIFAILLLFSVIAYSQTGTPGNPPDKPITPQEWIKNMNFGSWWLFTTPNESDNKITTANYSQRIVDSLQAIGVNGGRLHWQANDDFQDDLTLPSELIEFYDTIIDHMLDRGMSICLQVHFTDKDMTKEVLTRTINGWRQVCDAYKDKSHYLAMCPVIEFHGWNNYYLLDGDTVWNDDSDKYQAIKRDSLNWLYDSLTVIFREYNPTRIMSYKPWGSSKRGELETLSFPFGNDPAPHSGEPIYYMASLSGSYGQGEWYKWRLDMEADTLQMIKEQAMRAGSATEDWGIHKAINYRDTSGIQFWIDHWDPAFWKRLNGTYTDHWSVEQNVAYMEFMTDTLRAIGSCGAGMQTRRFWNDITDELVKIGDLYLYDTLPTDSLSVLMMDMLKRKNVEFQEPKILSVPETEAVVNTEYKYSVLTQGVGELKLESAPQWLSLSENTLTGTPSDVGDFIVEITFATDTQSFTISVTKETTGIYSDNSCKYSVYPNPAHNIIYFTKDASSVVELYSITGQEIMSTTDEYLKTDNLNRGIYILIIKDNFNQVAFTEKLIIN